MKRLFIYLMLFVSLGCYSQNYSYNGYMEFGFGGMIPTDKSNSYVGVQCELGKYVSPTLGIGLEFKTGFESEYDDRLSYIGINTRNNVFSNYYDNYNFDIIAGVGYGWYSYISDDDYYYHYYNHRNINSFVVPKVGLNCYFAIIQNCYIGICPEFAWYISTNKEKSQNTGVFNIFAKLKYTL